MQSKADVLSWFASMQDMGQLWTARQKPSSTPTNEKMDQEVIDMLWKNILVNVQSKRGLMS